MYVCADGHITFAAVRNVSWVRCSLLLCCPSTSAGFNTTPRNPWLYHACPVPSKRQELAGYLLFSFFLHLSHLPPPAFQSGAMVWWAVGNNLYSLVMNLVAATQMLRECGNVSIATTLSLSGYHHHHRY